MKIALNIAARDVCVLEIWEDKVPRLAAALRERLPITSIAQHGKIVGDLLFFSLPWDLPAENVSPLQDISRQRRQQKGTASGAVCFYHPRQQICIYYSDDLPTNRWTSPTSVRSSKERRTCSSRGSSAGPALARSSSCD